jgi:hypothetical protein
VVIVGVVQHDSLANPANPADEVYFAQLGDCINFGRIHMCPDDTGPVKLCADCLVATRFDSCQHYCRRKAATSDDR